MLIKEYVKKGAIKLFIANKGNNYQVEFKGAKDEILGSTQVFYESLVLLYASDAYKNGLLIELTPALAESHLEKKIETLMAKINKTSLMDVEDLSHHNEKVDLTGLSKIKLVEVDYDGLLIHNIEFYNHSSKIPAHSLTNCSDGRILEVAKKYRKIFDYKNIRDEHLKGNIDNIFHGKPLISKTFPNGLNYNRKNLEAQNGK